MKRQVLLAVVAIMIANSAVADAQGDVERLRLEQLKTALEAALPIVDLGKSSQARGDTGYVARWDKIELELQTIILGVDEVLDLPRREPRVRVFEAVQTPVTGEYLP